MQPLAHCRCSVHVITTTTSVSAPATITAGHITHCAGFWRQREAKPNFCLQGTYSLEEGTDERVTGHHMVSLELSWHGPDYYGSPEDKHRLGMKTNVCCFWIKL